MKKITVLLLSVTLLLCSCSTRNTQDSGDSLAMPETKNALSLFMDSPDTLHPLYTTQSSNAEIYDLIYDPLLYVKSDMSIEGVLAESVTVSNDAKSIRISLKDGVTWHDGTPFTADDVKYTFDLIKSNNPISTYKSRLADMSSIVVNDNLQCTLYLKRPNARILYLLDFPIVPSHRTDIDTSPCGTGAYMFKELVPNKNMLLTKNTLWTLGDVPISENVNVKILRDTGDILSIFKVGDISVVRADTKELNAVGYTDNIGITQYPTLKYEYIGFNLMEGSFADPAVRHAVSAAIDRESVLNDAYFSYGQIVNAPIPPSSFMYNKEADNPVFVEGAHRQILSDAGYADSNSDGIYDNGENQIAGSILVNNDNASRVACANAIATKLCAGGISVWVDAVPWDTYIERLYAGSFTMFLAGIDFSSNLDLSRLLSSSGVVDGLNFMDYASQDMDSAINETYTAITNEETEKAYLHIEYIFSRDMPITGLFFLDNALLYSPKLCGVTDPCESKVYKCINKWHFE